MIHVHAEAVKNINTAAAEINNQIRCSIFRGAVENRPFVFRKDTNEDFMHDPGEPLFPLFYRNHSLCGPVLPVSLYLGSRRCFLLWNRRTSPSEQQTRRAGRIFTSAGYKKQSDCSGSLCILVFLTVEALIFTGMFHHPSENLDYLVVLGAQVNGTKLSNSLRLRVERAGEYLEENPETKAVLSGGKGTGEDITEAEAMYRYLEKKGISPERLLKEEHSTNTSENLKFSLEIIDKKEDNRGKEASIGVVTNNFHVYRGVSLGKKLGCRHVEGIPAKSNAFLQVNYLVREFFGVLKDKAVGNM